MEGVLHGFILVIGYSFGLNRLQDIATMLAPYAPYAWIRPDALARANGAFT